MRKHIRLKATVEFQSKSLQNGWDWLLTKPERLTALSTFAIFLATATAVGIGIAQWRALYSTDEAIRIQADIMRRQLDDAEIQEAASVTIRNLTITGFPDNTIVSFDVVNSGRTRADQVIVPVISSYFQLNDELGILTGKGGLGGPTNPNPLGVSIEPSDPPRHMSVQLGSIPFWHKEIPIPAEVLKKLPTKDDFISGRREIIFAIVGVYLDVFGKVHHVTDCVISRGGTDRFEPCIGQQNRHD